METRDKKLPVDWLESNDRLKQFMHALVFFLVAFLGEGYDANRHDHDHAHYPATNNHTLFRFLKGTRKPHTGFLRVSHIGTQIEKFLRCPGYCF